MFARTPGRDILTDAPIYLQRKATHVAGPLVRATAGSIPHICDDFTFRELTWALIRKGPSLLWCCPAGALQGTAWLWMAAWVAMVRSRGRPREGAPGAQRTYMGAQRAPTGEARRRCRALIGPLAATVTRNRLLAYRQVIANTKKAEKDHMCIFQDIHNNGQGWGPGARRQRHRYGQEPGSLGPRHGRAGLKKTHGLRDGMDLRSLTYGDLRF